MEINLGFILVNENTITEYYTGKQKYHHSFEVKLVYYQSTHKKDIN